jgi:hypothetical protein
MEVLTGRDIEGHGAQIARRQYCGLPLQKRYTGWGPGSGVIA